MDLLKAVKFAADKHRDQRRKGIENTPYINHPIAVAEILGLVGDLTRIELLQAALLHDTIEDTDTTPEELKDHFCAEVRDLVVELTDDKTKLKDERKRLQIEHASQLSPLAKAIKLADKIANVTDIMNSPPADWSNARRLEYLAWSDKVVAGCRDANKKLLSE